MLSLSPRHCVGGVVKTIGERGRVVDRVDRSTQVDQLTGRDADRLLGAVAVDLHNLKLSAIVAHANDTVMLLENRESGKVAVSHVSHVHSHRAQRDIAVSVEAQDALRKGVAGLEQ